MTTLINERTNSALIESLKQLQQLRHCYKPLSEYWEPLLNALLTICSGTAGIIALHTDTNEQQWKTIVTGPAGPDAQQRCKQLTKTVPAAVRQCAQDGYACFRSDDGFIIAVNMIIDINACKCVALFHVLTFDESVVRERIDALLSVNDLPALHRMNQSALDALKTQSRLTDILDIMVQLNSQHRIIAAAMTVCNELATRYKCDRVSIGWIKNGYVKVTAISHTDHFEKKMNIIEKLEIAMEEARDQDAEIIYPSQSETSAVITRDHEIYAQAQDIKFIATLPLRKKDEVVALILLERNHTPFSDTEIRQLRVSIDQFSTRLIELHKRDRWFGARIASWFRDGFGALLGYEHTWAKIFAISTCIILAIVSFVPVQYRVSSPVILRTDDISYLTAPFDGYIDSAGCNPGELVDSGAVILTLDNQDLLLEQAALIAERDREQREIEKARAAQELADMCISQARMDQVTAKLQINNYRLGQAAIHSPFDGIIIEGDLKERLGSPVKQGEILFKTGRLKDIFAEAKVHEAEIQNIFSGSKGQIALSSRPQEHFNIKVKLIEPSATISENKNVYLVRCTLADTMPRWFRPGMTGISKINAGKKTILWIISHRTIDFLRLKLWW